MGKTSIFLFLSVSMLSFMASARGLFPCDKSLPLERDHSFYLYDAYCDEQDNLRLYQLRFRSNGVVSVQYTLDESGKITGKQIRSSYDELTSLEKWQWERDQIYRIRSFHPKEQTRLVGQSWVELQNDGEMSTVVLKSDFVSNQGKVKYRDTWMDSADKSQKLISRRDYFDSNEQLEKSYLFKYKPFTVRTPRIVESFQILDRQGRVTGVFNADASTDLVSKILNHPMTSDLAKKYQMRVFQDKTREPVVIIDSGFEYAHPALTFRMHNNAKDPLNGVDDDNDGWVDNMMGYFSEPDFQRETNKITELLIWNGNESPDVPFSHGTHVASIALSNADKFSLVGFGGDYSQPDYLDKISSWITSQRVRFVNMSFGFGGRDLNNPFAAGDNSRHALSDMVKKNPNTLFFAAAGNDGRDLNIPENEDWPATLPFNNTVVVGALDASHLDRTKLPQLDLVNFSNHGEEHVDVAAPGVDVYGANLGQSWLAVSGTSMASPWAMNIGLRVAEENDKLTTQQIKEVLMKTVYIRDLKNPLKVRSGGLLIPERAILAARLMKENSSLSVERACLLAHEKISWDHERRGASLAELVSFWRQRGL